MKTIKSRTKKYDRERPSGRKKLEEIVFEGKEGAKNLENR